MSRATNAEIAKVLREIGEYLTMEDAPFRPRAYEKAAEAVDGLSEQLADIYQKGGLEALKQIDGIGEAISLKVEEFLRTGRLKYYEDLRRKTPVNLDELSKVEGLGPKKILKLYKNLKIKNISGLERAALAGKIAKLPEFGAKSQENILRSIGFVKKSGGRKTLGEILPEVRKLEERLGSLPGVKYCTAAGSVRRRKETVGDIDILIVSRSPARTMDYFVSMPEVVRVLAHGKTKSSVHLNLGLDADLRVVPEESYGAALNYFTGSKDHNVSLRKIAQNSGMKLNEYGLFKLGRSSVGKMVAGRTEEEVYKSLGLAYIEPEMRENNGEIELARKNDLPKLVGYSDLRGDLQMHSDWSDGGFSIEDMAKSALALGREYIAITDHSAGLKVAGGLDDKRLKKQMAEIDRLNKKFAGRIKILKGIECDILKDGRMELPNEVLAQLDLVGASVHSFFHMDKKDQTVRVIRAMENKNVDIIFHPTGRLIGRRDALELNMAEIISSAHRTGTVLEIDSFPDRLDLKDEYIRMCINEGVALAIDTDAHSPEHLKYLEYGISQARRGFAQRRDIINAWPISRMKKYLKNK